MMKSALIALLVAPAASVLLKSDACESADLKNRALFQNKLAGECEEMCKEVGAYPDKCTCPNFVQPDATPGVMTWPELLDHMDNLVAWGKETAKDWSKQASALQQSVKGASNSKACLAQDLEHRMQVQNKLASACVDMCKEVGAYPKCECPDFAAPDATPGVMTWPELLEHMDNLEAWGNEMIKKQKSRAALLQGSNQTQTNVSKKVSVEASAKVVNQTQAVKVANQTVVKICTSATIKWNTPPSSDWTEVTSAPGACYKKPGMEKITLCGYATLHYTTQMNCESPTDLVHGSDKTLADCTTVEDASLFNSLSHTCPY